ncbi:type VI secretion system-associated protein TagO [Vibrio diabolicus]|uniref:type VI secretion system-associated protein TagO n=1 Tax=Vibrio diabolicus TaxID=50719 RepID=UPI003D7EA56E
MNVIKLNFLSALVLVPTMSVASDFEVDMPVMSVVEQFKTLNINSLAVGESGLVSSYSLSMCVDNKSLKISAITELESNPSEYSYVYEITRQQNNRVSMILSNKGKKPDFDAFKRSVLYVASAQDCSELRKRGISLLSVNDFLGSGSLSDLVAEYNTVVREPKQSKENHVEDTKSDKPLSNWLVLNSKSPIDDSPRVTMIKEAEFGDQTLVLRCNEDKTDAYIDTGDYLGENSQTATVRFGQDKAKKMKFILSTNKKALFVNSAIPYIKSMQNVDSMVLRYSTYNGSSKTVTFKIDDLDTGLKSLREACHW